ncbi:MAG: hypothetical protein IJN43_14850 [Ruminococcus sp.]|nr:hypothetical protein [Ruminococcus sp.]
MNEYQKKREFVANHLEPLVKAADCSVESVVYTSDSGEYVTIRYRKSSYEIKVNVGADSLAALTRDVMKKI